MANAVPPTEPPYVGAFLLSGASIFGGARKAYKRIEGTHSGKPPSLHDALASILFSASALEAFIAEVAIVGRMVPPNDQDRRYILDVADALDEIESNNGSTRLKYLTAKILLPGEAYDRGNQPYQDFDLLFAVRNAIIHHRPQRLSMEPNKIIKRLEPRGLASPTAPPTVTTWLSQLHRQPIAKWACNVAATMSRSIADAATGAEIGARDDFLGTMFDSLAFDHIR